MNIPILHSYEKAHKVSRRDVEEAIQKEYDLGYFWFHVVEHSEGNYLALREEDAQEECFRPFVQYDEEDEISEGSEVLEDAAHLLLCKLFGESFKEVILVEEDRKLLLLV